jgi:hypothetical protein
MVIVIVGESLISQLDDLVMASAKLLGKGIQTTIHARIGQSSSPWLAN